MWFLRHKEFFHKNGPCPEIHSFNPPIFYLQATKSIKAIIDTDFLLVGWTWLPVWITENESNLHLIITQEYFEQIVRLFSVSPPGVVENKRRSVFDRSPVIGRYVFCLVCRTGIVLSRAFSDGGYKCQLLVNMLKINVCFCKLLWLPPKPSTQTMLISVSYICGYFFHIYGR